MLFETFANKVTKDRGIKHPDDIAFLHEEMRLGWDAAMQSMGGTHGSTPDQIRVIKLRTAFYLLEQDVRYKLDETNHLLHRYNQDAIEPRQATRDKIFAEGQGYAASLDLINKHMRKLGLDHSN